MFNWAKQQMANVVGTEEPIYGPSACHTVTKQAETTPYTELTRNDLKWNALSGTNVETQGFYFTSDSGHLAMAQIIYSCVSGLRTTVQFNTKIFYPKSTNKPKLWSSDALSNVDFSEDKCSFYAKDVAVELNAEGSAYTIKSMSNQSSIVNLTVTRVAPGFMAGKDGKTTFGTNEKEPWGSVFHKFWPRCKAEGTIMTKDGPIDLKGGAMFVHALQNMKPHHAAAKWQFCDFQGEKYSAIMMEFQTPPSYGSTKINVGAIVTDTEIIIANASGTVTHVKSEADGQNGWSEPTDIKYEYNGKTRDGKTTHATVEGPMDERLDKVDVMAEVPKFVKQIVASAAGTKPYIYQYSPHATPISLKLKIGDDEIVDKGRLFAEATFIS